MKNDVLERLLIDRAAGELSPDVRELLEDHLQRDPAARKEAATIEDTMRLARVAMVDEKVVPLPSPSATRRTPSLAWAMAACFVCGLALGILALHVRNTTPQTASMPVTQTVATAPAPDSDFWSVRHLRAEVPPVTVKTDRVVWKSLFRKPETL